VRSRPGGSGTGDRDRGQDFTQWWLSRQTIYRGLSELESGKSSERVRAVGGDRKRLSERQPKLVGKLEALIAPSVRGDPQSALRWTTRSTRTCA
jgi:hypothetical protein